MTETPLSEQKAWTPLVMQIRRQQVILTAGICLILLAIILKNVLFVPADILIRDMTLYIIIYSGFLLFAFRTDDAVKVPENVPPVVWDLLVVIVTLAIIAVYALQVKP